MCVWRRRSLVSLEAGYPEKVREGRDKKTRKNQNIKKNKVLKKKAKPEKVKIKKTSMLSEAKVWCNCRRKKIKKKIDWK